jgi:hypothetical protein
MFEYLTIAVLAFVFAVTYWRKNVWKRRFRDKFMADLAVSFGSSFGGILGEQIRAEIARRAQEKAEEWPELVDKKD